MGKGWIHADPACHIPGYMDKTLSWGIAVEVALGAWAAWLYDVKKILS